MNKLSTSRNAATQSQRLIWITGETAILLIIPLVVMQFTDEVKWSLFDFIAAAALLFGSSWLSNLHFGKLKKTPTALWLVQSF